MEYYKVTWEEGRDHCLLDGQECTDEWLREKCGCDEELTITENAIVDGGVNVYINMPFKLKDLLEVKGYFNEAEDYDFISNEGYGYISHAAKEKFGNCYIIGDSDGVVYPMDEFYKKYPNFDLKEYNKIWESIYKYYEDFQNEVLED